MTKFEKVWYTTKAHTAGDVSLLHQNVERDEQIQIRLSDILRRHDM